MNTVIPSLTSLFKRSRRPLMYGSMAAITIGLEGLFESIVFNCPCEGHYTYGLAFLWAPALLLFLAGILVDRDLWKHPRRNSSAKKKTLARRYFKSLMAILDVLIRAGIAPVAWLILSFLQQQYYTCAYFGPPLTGEVTVSNATEQCLITLGTRTRSQEEKYKTRSQIAGWSLMLVAMSVLFITICIRRCVQKGKHLHIPSLDYYHHVEAKEALEHYHIKAKELAKEKAQREIHQLFLKSARKDFNTRLRDVGKGIQNKYGQFFIIPPESPSYNTPESAPDDPPQFHNSSGVDRTLLADGSAGSSDEGQQGLVSATNTQCSSETCQTAYTSPRGYARVALYRQGAFDKTGE